MREICTSGSVRGVARKGHSYRDLVFERRTSPLHYRSNECCCRNA